MNHGHPQLSGVLNIFYGCCCGGAKDFDLKHEEYSNGEEKMNIEKPSASLLGNQLGDTNTSCTAKLNEYEERIKKLESELETFRAIFDGTISGTQAENAHEKVAVRGCNERR